MSPQPLSRVGLLGELPTVRVTVPASIPTWLRGPVMDTYQLIQSSYLT